MLRVTQKNCIYRVLHINIQYKVDWTVKDFFFFFLRPRIRTYLFVRNCRKASGFFKEEVLMLAKKTKISFSTTVTYAFIFRLIHYYSQCHRPKSRKWPNDSQHFVSTCIFFSLFGSILIFSFLYRYTVSLNCSMWNTCNFLH